MKMKFNSALRNFVLVLFSTLLISACSTAKKASVDTVDDVSMDSIVCTIKYHIRGCRIHGSS